MSGWAEVISIGPVQLDRPLRIDKRALDAQGAPAWVSLCLVPPGQRVPFDDAGISQALRRVLARPWPRLVSTLLIDWATFAGSITVAGERRSLLGDPFARLLPQQVFEVPAGLFGSVPAPCGPAITRYGSGNPWPWDVYRGQHP